MFVHDPLVVGQHKGLVVPDDLQQAFQVGNPIGLGVRNVGQNIDRCGNQHESEQAEQDIAKYPKPAGGGIWFHRPFTALPEQGDEIQQGHTDAAIQNDPLAGYAQTEHQTAEEQGNHTLAKWGTCRKGQIAV